jgi:hypothetical protein
VSFVPLTVAIRLPPRKTSYAVTPTLSLAVPQAKLTEVPVCPITRRFAGLDGDLWSAGGR